MARSRSVPRPSWRHYLRAGGALVGGALLLGVLFIYSGIYDISARRDHFAIVTWLLEVVRIEAVETHSAGIEVPPLDAPELARLGALYFDAGCAPCHGAPGRPASAFADAMLPPPPGLAETAAGYDPAALFWIVRNGFKYTGMPAWLAPDRADEIWPVVAFLWALPAYDAEGYRALLRRDEAAAEPLPRSPETAALLDRCIACHGAPDGRPVAPQVPVIAGLPQVYLERALHEYAAGTRESGMMRLYAAPLTDREIAALAAYYAAAAAPSLAGPPAAGDAGHGEAIFSRGAPAQDLPACASCHSGTATVRFAPPLNGQSARYVVQQLENWQAGMRMQTPQGRLMGLVAQRMDPAQMRDVAVYLQGLPAMPPAGKP